MLEVNSSPTHWTNEAGGHRFQRVPPNERRGRVHTSTVTVAVVVKDGDERGVSSDVSESSRDLKISWYSGTGAGGQHRNKHQNACRVLHVPSGVVVKAETRSRSTSLETALRELKTRLAAVNERERHGSYASSVRAQVGSGMRGDKVRTYRLQDDVVIDHRTSGRARWTAVQRGDLSGLVGD